VGGQKLLGIVLLHSVSSFSSHVRLHNLHVFVASCYQANNFPFNLCFLRPRVEGRRCAFTFLHFHHAHLFFWVTISISSLLRCLATAPFANSCRLDCHTKCYLHSQLRDTIDCRNNICLHRRTIFRLRRLYTPPSVQCFFRGFWPAPISYICYKLKTPASATSNPLQNVVMLRVFLRCM